MERRLRIPEIRQIDCAYLSVVYIKANVIDDFVSFSILSLITYPNRMFLDERRHYFITHQYEIEEFWTSRSHFFRLNSSNSLHTVQSHTQETVMVAFFHLFFLLCFISFSSSALQMMKFLHRSIFIIAIA